MHGKFTASTLHANDDLLQFAEVATGIAQKLVDTAIWHENRCTWTGDDVELLDNKWKIVHKTIDPYLYSGASGIALFLVQCWQLTGNRSFMQTALAALRQAFYLIEKSHTHPPPAGLYDGITGICIVAMIIASQENIDELYHQAESLLGKITHQCRTESSSFNTDIISGHAGIIIGLLQIAQINPNAEIDEACHILVEELLASVTETEYGAFWKDKDQPHTPGLCGLGHGASGIALALLEYHQQFNNASCLNIAEKALLYEKGWLNHQVRNWPDIRDHRPEDATSQKLVYPVYWCHGAAGIGLARLRAWQLLGREDLLADATVAIQAATAHARHLIKTSRKTHKLLADANLSLCHGLGSIIDLFSYASQITSNPELLTRARDIGKFAMHNGIDNNQQWRCGIHNGGETPGLMLGLSGIGYSLLNLYRPRNYTCAGMALSFS